MNNRFARAGALSAAAVLMTLAAANAAPWPDASAAYTDVRSRNFFPEDMNVNGVAAGSGPSFSGARWSPGPPTAGSGSSFTTRR